MTRAVLPGQQAVDERAPRLFPPPLSPLPEGLLILHLPLFQVPSSHDQARKLVLGEKQVLKDETVFLCVSTHDSRETREKKQAVNPLESTDSACLHSHCRFLWSNGWGSGGSCGAAEGQLYITLLKVITEILKWNHSAARVCSNPLQRCLGQSRGLSVDVCARRSSPPPLSPLVFSIIIAGLKRAPYMETKPIQLQYRLLGLAERRGSERGKVVSGSRNMHTLQRPGQQIKG